MRLTGYLLLTGSSPRVRGTEPRPRRVQRTQRFIPACAGNSSNCLSPGARATVHPRVCGEQYAALGDLLNTIGSSPRVRGTVLKNQFSELLLRFIPACAGNSLPAILPYSVVSVHPRVCGEQTVRLAQPADFSGSSPRVRGTARAFDNSYFIRRFIPACAGNSLVGPCPVGSQPVHPRVCGEQIPRRAMSQTLSGSSPRVRGTACLLLIQTYM